MKRCRRLLVLMWILLLFFESNGQLASGRTIISVKSDAITHKPKIKSTEEPSITPSPHNDANPLSAFLTWDPVEDDKLWETKPKPNILETRPRTPPPRIQSSLHRIPGLRRTRTKQKSYPRNPKMISKRGYRYTQSEAEIWDYKHEMKILVSNLVNYIYKNQIKAFFQRAVKKFFGRIPQKFYRDLMEHIRDKTTKGFYKKRMKFFFGDCLKSKSFRKLITGQIHGTLRPYQKLKVKKPFKDLVTNHIRRFYDNGKVDRFYKSYYRGTYSRRLKRFYRKTFKNFFGVIFRDFYRSVVKKVNYERISEFFEGYYSRVPSLQLQRYYDKSVKQTVMKITEDAFATAVEQRLRKSV